MWKRENWKNEDGKKRKEWEMRGSGVGDRRWCKKKE
jgi:hypothetical protein